MKKCNDFEKYFTSDNEAEFKEHIKNCPDCKAELEKMEKVSSLIKEAIPLIRRREMRVRTRIMATAASFFVAFAAFFTIQFVNPNSFINETLAYLQYSDYSYEQMGLPVDDMGFIMVDFDEE